MRRTLVDGLLLPLTAHRNNPELWSFDLDVVDALRDRLQGLLDAAMPPRPAGPDRPDPAAAHPVTAPPAPPAPDVPVPDVPATDLLPEISPAGSGLATTGSPRMHRYQVDVLAPDAPVGAPPPAAPRPSVISALCAVPAVARYLSTDNVQRFWGRSDAWTPAQLWHGLHLVGLGLPDRAAEDWRRALRDAAHTAGARVLAPPGVRTAAEPPDPSVVRFPGLSLLGDATPIHPGLDLPEPPDRAWALDEPVLASLGRRLPMTASAAQLVLDLIAATLIPAGQLLPLAAPHSMDKRLASANRDLYTTQFRSELRFLEENLSDPSSLGSTDSRVRHLLKADERIWSVLPWPVPCATALTSSTSTSSSGRIGSPGVVATATPPATTSS